MKRNQIISNSYLNYRSRFYIYAYGVLCIICLTAVVEPHPPEFRRYQHVAVLENEAWEQSLPNELKNPFYRTPRVREALAHSSWFGPGETVVCPPPLHQLESFPCFLTTFVLLKVFNRQAEKISRREIYNVLNHAGLLPKRFYKRSI